MQTRPWSQHNYMVAIILSSHYMLHTKRFASTCVFCIWLDVCVKLKSLFYICHCMLESIFAASKFTHKKFCACSCVRVCARALVCVQKFTCFTKYTCSFAFVFMYACTNPHDDQLVEQQSFHLEMKARDCGRMKGVS
jgi:hypothetical protein